jgi:hypothetical protein
MILRSLYQLYPLSVFQRITYRELGQKVYVPVGSTLPVCRQSFLHVFVCCGVFSVVLSRFSPCMVCSTTGFPGCWLMLFCTLSLCTRVLNHSFTCCLDRLITVSRLTSCGR